MCMHSAVKARRKYNNKGVVTKDWLMEQIESSPLPTDMNEFLARRVFAREKYMFFATLGRGHHEGACQHCGAEHIALEKPKAGATGRCPVCGGKIRYRNIKHSQTINDQQYVAVVQTVMDGKRPLGLVVRKLRAWRQTDYLSVTYDWLELERDFFEPGREFRAFQIRWRWNGARNIAVWINGEYSHMSARLPDRFFVYEKGLTKTLSDFKEYKYCQLQTLARHETVDPSRYFIKYRQRPQLEYFVKAKMYRLAGDIAADDYGSHYLDFSQKKLSAVLRLTKREHLQIAVKCNFGLNEIRVLQECDHHEVKFEKRFLPLYDRIHFESKIFDHISVNQWCRYALTQLKKPKRVDIDNLWNDYRDVWSACKDLNLNFGDTMYSQPKDFKKTHDRIMDEKAAADAAKREKANRKRDKALALLAGEYKPVYEYAGPDFSVLVPTTCEDFERESARQGNCVRTYIDRVLAKRSVVLFVRRTGAEEQSFVTMEVNPADGRIVQVRSSHNGSAPEEVNMFLKAWKKEVDRRILKMKQMIEDGEVTAVRTA